MFLENRVQLRFRPRFHAQRDERLGQREPRVLVIGIQLDPAAAVGVTK